MLVKNITGFLEDEYKDQQLTLTLLAEKFDLSEAYLSHLFKEHTGENFSSCLERIRMNNAHRLLENSDMSIENIAKSIGYNSDDTFRRAFKRYHGISPAAYRLSTGKAQQ